MRRANNQDSLACLPASHPDRFRLRGHLFIVADGMGAHAAGELASRIATERIAFHFFKSADTRILDSLRDAVHEANAEIHRRGQQNPEFHNMGTTASSLALTAQGAIVAHVGDSRVYRLRGESLEQMTFDHSLVWELEASGQVNANSPLRHTIPKNVITRSLGPNAEVAVDIEGPFPIEAGDTFILCSDGLTGQVEDHEIGALVAALTPELATRVLVDLANLRGGPDNTTVIIVRVEDDELFAANNAKSPPAGLFDRVSPLLVGLAGLCFLWAAVMLVLQVWNQVIVPLILGVVATGFAFAQWKSATGKRSKRLPPLSTAGGKAPYRRYSARATEEHHQRLVETVKSLRKASETKTWSINWEKIDRLQQVSQELIRSRQLTSALRHEAEAIVETMHQLREQRSKPLDDSALDY